MTEGETVVTAQQVLAGKKGLLENLDYWIEWCDQHPSGGAFPDTDGKTIDVPAEMINPARTELQQRRDHLKLELGESVAP